jgi:hypothetical protein
MATLAAASSAAGGQEQPDPQINEDIEFIKANISASGSPAVLEALKYHIMSKSTNKTRGLSAENKGLFDTVKESSNNVFFTLHGTPILAHELNSNVKPIFQVPPGCIIVMIAPPGTVVYGGEEEDMASYRFFKQKNWPGANATSDERKTCFGAERAISSLTVDEAQAELYSLDDDADETPDSIAGRVSKRYEDLRDKLEELEEERVHKKALNTGVCSEKMREDLKNELTRLFPENKYGKEILENLQIFFPGEWVYNQFQEWEYNAQESNNPRTRGYDLNFDIFKLGTHVDTYSDTFKSQHNMPAGIELTHTTGLTTQLPIQFIEQEHCQVVNFRTPSFLHPLSKMLKDTLGPDMKSNSITTEYLIKQFMSDGSTKMIVLNSCSPYRETKRRKHKKKVSPHANLRHSIANAANLLLRNYLYNDGRSNFCNLRQYCKSLLNSADHPSDLNHTIVPQYDEHRGITVAFNDDREDFYVTLGNVIKSAKSGHIIFTPTLFKTFLDLCDKSDKTGKLLHTFKRLYNNFLRHPGSQQSKDHKQILPFDKEIELLEKAKLGQHWTTIAGERAKLYINPLTWSNLSSSGSSVASSGSGESKDVEMGGVDMGGGRKRRKRKTKKKKTKKKKRKIKKNKTKRKYGGDPKKKKKKPKEIEMKTFNKTYTNSSQLNKEAQQRLQIAQQRRREIQRLQRLQYSHHRQPLGKTGESKGSSPGKKKNPKKTGIVIEEKDTDKLYYGKYKGSPPLRGGNRRRTRKQRRKKKKKTY